MNTNDLNMNMNDYQPKSLLQRLDWKDWAYAAILIAGAIFAFSKYAQYMDAYETGFLFVFAAVFSFLG